MSEDRVFEALQSMRAEVAAVTSGITRLTDVVGTLQVSMASMEADIREIRRDLSDLRSAMTEHLSWHLGQAGA
jgi:hypothetical protein